MIPGSEEFWGAIGTPLTGLIVIVLLWAKARLERNLNHTTEVVKNGIQGRLDKIESGVFGVRTEVETISSRVQTLEESVSGGSGQHFRPPSAVANVGSAAPVEATPMSPSEHVVPGTVPEN